MQQETQREYQGKDHLNSFNSPFQFFLHFLYEFLSQLQCRESPYQLLSYEILEIKVCLQDIKILSPKLEIFLSG